MINNIQALRAFAALNVVYFHVIGAAQAYGQNVQQLSFLEGWGSNGVDVFFVISGFVMVYAQDLREKSSVQFFFGRIARIVPVYWVLTMALFFLHLLLPSLFRESDVTIFQALTSFGFVSQYFGFSYPVLYTGWTLEWEMLFYMVFALSLLVDSRIRIPLLVASLSLLALSVNVIVVEFLFGVLVAWAHRRFAVPARLGSVMFIAGMILLSASIFIELDLPGWALSGVPSIFIVLGALKMGQIRNKYFVFFGGASYSIYLVQIFTIPFFYKLSSVYAPGLNGDMLSLYCLIMTALGGGCFIGSLSVGLL